MAAPVNNQFWKVRSSHGRNPIFADSEQLWDACLEYFEWVEANPLHEQKVFCASGAITTHNLPKMRAMTLMGLCNFLDICHETWTNYKKKDDFIGVITRAERLIYQQKFEGAAADMLNPNIIARDLGLGDKRQQDGRVTVVELQTNFPEKEELRKLTNEELRRRVNENHISENKLTRAELHAIINSTD